MGRFEPTGPVNVPGLEHSVATLSWGVLRGAFGPSDGSAGAGSNVPSALGVVRHADLYAELPGEIEEAFAVLEQHVMRHDRLYPVAIASLPFLFDTVRRGTPVSERVAELIALYAANASTLEPPGAERLLQIVSDHAGEIVRWFGRFDRALCALAIHVLGLREMFIAAVEGAERVSPIVLLALVELGVAPGETLQLAQAMLDGPDATNVARMCAASFLASFGDPQPELVERIDAALPPNAPAALRKLAGGFWTPTIERPDVPPKMCEAEVVFTGKKIVLVRAGERSVTLPWAGADVEVGDRIKLGLSTHGQPKIAVVTDWHGNTRTVDF